MQLSEMTEEKNISPWRCQWAEDDPAGHSTLRLFGHMGEAEASPMLAECSAQVRERQPSGLTVDLSGVIGLDDFGVLVLVELKQMLHDRGQTFTLRGQHGEAAEVLAFFHFDTLGEEEKTPVPQGNGAAFVALGEATISVWSGFNGALTFIGDTFFALLHILRNPRALRKADTLENMQKTGVDALPIVGLISFLLGLIMAFMSAVQLRQFGANIYVASLVSLSMTRELGPIMTGIIVAGRSGSSYAAEIGTMKISEEVDALTTMGFDPTVFLVLPRMLAAIAVVPLLTLFSDLFAIMGGLVVGVTMLDVTVTSYLAQTAKTLDVFDVFWGVMKSGFFAFLISGIGCLRGFQVTSGAAAVGRATTSAVVSSIFAIILSDSIFSVILRYWD